ncbi:helix-turn-helix transcriptional regulator [Pedobacter sp. PAMC26386]|nr:helix-turn-helix transcriptional regulator [Pedobacter sp. PAMC26386]
MSICLVKYLKDEDFVKKFGQKLKQIREGKGISQEQLSLLAEVSQSQIARTELGQINTSISHASTYAKFLKVNPMDLFDFADLKVKEKK